MKSKDYYIAQNWPNQKEIFAYLKSHKGIIAVDTEATGANALQDDIIGASFSIKQGEAFYIPVPKDEDQLFDFRKDLIELLENKDKQIIMHNSVYDTTLLKKTMAVDTLPYLVADTILMKHTIDESRPHGLKECAVKYLGEEWKDEQKDLKESVKANGGTWTKAVKDFGKADPLVLGKYACADADMTLRLYNIFKKELNEQKLDTLFINEVMPLNSVVTKMYRKGCKVDVNYYSSLKDELKNETKRLEDTAHAELMGDHTELYQRLEETLLQKVACSPTGRLIEQLFIKEDLPIMHHPKTGKPTFTKKVAKDLLEDYPNNYVLKWKLGEKKYKDLSQLQKKTIYDTRKEIFCEKNGARYVVNLNSNDQLGEILFNELGEKAKEKTEKGNNKVDQAVLESFRDKYKFIDCMVQFRKINKLLSTYVEAALSKNIDGVVHPNWVQYGTESGRFSSRDPNYQNLPRDDKRIKKGIVAREGRVLVGADYSQLEPRCFAHCSREKTLIDAYKRGEDLYGTIAVELFNLDCSPNEVKTKYPDERQISKTVMLAVTYGAKKWKISKVVNKEVGKEVLSLDDADKLIKKIFKKYKYLDKYIKQCHGQAIKHGRVVNEAGRVRHLDFINQVKGSRNRADIRMYHSILNLSTNFPIQSLAATIVNRAMIRLDEMFQQLGIDACILIQVHDEIITECAEKDAEQVKDLMKNVMENTYKLSVPLVAEPIIAKRLSDTK